MVKTLRPGPNQPTVPEALQNLHPGLQATSIGWDGEVTDNCYGFVRIRAAVPAPQQMDIYFFDVNLSGQRLHPANDKARKLLSDIAKPTPDSPPNTKKAEKLDSIPLPRE